VNQGCQMAYFQTKKLIWVNFGGSCIERFWYILWPFGLFYGHLVYCYAIWYMYFMVIWSIFRHFGMLTKDKSGNHGVNMHSRQNFRFSCQILHIFGLCTFWTIFSQTHLATLSISNRQEKRTCVFGLLEAFAHCSNRVAAVRIPCHVLVHRLESSSWISFGQKLTIKFKRGQIYF
jgi:hypothetical protein